jgi:hypothetical protein
VIGQGFILVTNFARQRPVHGSVILKVVTIASIGLGGKHGVVSVSQQDAGWMLLAQSLNFVDLRDVTYAEIFNEVAVESTE